MYVETRIKQTVGLLVVCLCMLAGSWTGVWAAELDGAIEAIQSYQYGQSRKPLIAIEQLLASSGEGSEERDQLAARLAQLLDSDATVDCKKFVCRQLALIGGEDEVGALAVLLDDEELGAMARYALESIPGKRADKALRKALDDASGQMLVGLINSLGERRDAKAVRSLGKRIVSPDAEVAQAAAAALGKIGGKNAAKALRRALPDAAPNVRAVVVDACFACADRFLAEEQDERAREIYLELFAVREADAVRAVALPGVVRTAGDKADAWVLGALRSRNPVLQQAAIQCASDVPGAEFTHQLAGELRNLALAGQIQLLTELGARGDGAALPAVVYMTKSPREDVRVAALRAMGDLGEPAAIPLLAGIAATRGDNERQAARRALDRLQGESIEASMAANLTSANAGARAELLGSLGRRRAAGAVPVLLQFAGTDADPNVRVAALEALAVAGGPETLGNALGLLGQSRTKAESEQAEKTVLAIGRKVPDADALTQMLLGALASADRPQTKASLARVLGKAPAEPALPALRTLTKDPDASVRDAAWRAIFDWPTDAVTADLLEAATYSSNLTYRTLAVRGFLRLAGARADRPPAEALDMFVQGLILAQADPEKKTALGGIARLKSLETLDPEALNRALELVEPQLDVEEVRTEGAAAVLALAPAAGRSAPDRARAALLNVLKVSKDEKVRQAAQQAIGELPSQAPAAQTPADQATEEAPVQMKKGLPNPFFAMNTGTGKGSAAEQAQMLAELGYDGIGAGTTGVPEMRREIEQRGLKMFNVYTGAAIDSDEQAYDPQLKELIQQLAGSGAAIWLTLRSTKKLPHSSPEGDAQAVRLIRELADLAQAAGLSIALYPHTGSWLERTDDAVRLAKQVERPNVGATFNLCHWLRVEGDTDPRPVFERALPHLFFVTINGADGGKTTEMAWNRLIQTLDKGTYDVEKLLKALIEVGYKGPIGLQGYGIGGDARENLRGSMEAWQAMSSRIAPD